MEKISVIHGSKMLHDAGALGTGAQPVTAPVARSGAADI